MKKTAVFIVLFVLAGSSPCPAFLGFEGKPKAPPEYSQKILLEVNDEPKVHQAQRSGYDIGDLQAFHDQVALPMLVEDSFKEIFGQVEMVPKGADIETTPPHVPPIFQLHISSLMDCFSRTMEKRRWKDEIILIIVNYLLLIDKKG